MLSFLINCTPSRTTNESLFKVVYGQSALSPHDVMAHHKGDKMNTDASKRVKEIQEVHKRVQAQIEKENEHYKDQHNKHYKQASFKPGDLVWVHLRQERFPSKIRSKLMPRDDGPFEVLEKVNENAYKIVRSFLRL